jgi:hypothetical protein
MTAISIQFDDVPMIIQGRCVDCLFSGEADIDDDMGTLRVSEIRLPAEGKEVRLFREDGGAIYHALAEAILITQRERINEELAQWQPRERQSYEDEHRLRVSEVL